MKFLLLNPRRRALMLAVVAVAVVIGCDRREGTSSTGGGASATASQDHSAVAVATPGAQDTTADAGAADAPDPEVGRQVFAQTCASCHGFQAQGLPHQGAPLRTSAFVATHSDADLIAFIKKGRPAKDPTNNSGVAMPPRGNNPALSDARLADIVSWLRQVQAEAKADAASSGASAASASTDPTTTIGGGR
jgi:disulfide bond formation protein DsbB